MISLYNEDLPNKPVLDHVPTLLDRFAWFITDHATALLVVLALFAAAGIFTIAVRRGWLARLATPALLPAAIACLCFGYAIFGHIGRVGIILATLGGVFWIYAANRLRHY